MEETTTEGTVREGYGTVQNPYPTLAKKNSAL